MNGEKKTVKNDVGTPKNNKANNKAKRNTAAGNAEKTGKAASKSVKSAGGVRKSAGKNGKGGFSGKNKKPVKRKIPKGIEEGFRYSKYSPYNGIVDIRPYKKKLRAEIKKFRSDMAPSDKARLDKKIIGRVCNLWQYRNSDIIFTYVSTGIEIDTKGFIERAVKEGKTVAVPRCVEGTARMMDFYSIKSLDELESGSFGVLEPIPEKCEKITDYSKGLCIVPALAFDREGYRLGYGKGYYDRFLSEFCGETLGICYNECLLKVLPHGKYDRNVEKIVTQSEIIITENEKPTKEVKK